MAIDYTIFAIPKPAPRVKPARTRLRTHATPKIERDRIAEIRDYVRARERGRCRCCRFRPGTSMHELRPRSLGGKVSKRNSVLVCGDGVTGCHGFLQRHEIDYGDDGHGAEGVLTFIPHNNKASTHMRIKDFAVLESAPMRDMEQE